MPIPGMPQLPEVIFWSGDRCYLIREVPIRKYGTRHSRLFLIPEEQVKWRYNISDEELDYRVTGWGMLVKEYPHEYLHWLSQNPESGILLVFCNFDGSVNIDLEINELKHKIQSKEAVVSNLMTENTILREQYKIAVEQVRALRRLSIEEKRGA